MDNYPEDDHQPYDPTQGFNDGSFDYGELSDLREDTSVSNQQTENTQQRENTRSPKESANEENSYDDEDSIEIILNDPKEAALAASQMTKTQYPPQHNLRNPYQGHNNVPQANAQFPQQNKKSAAPINISLIGGKNQFQRIPSHSSGRANEQKTIFDLDIDSLDEKPWRKPGADITNYFNYGFTEDTWRSYCQKQIQMRLEQQMQSKIKVYESAKSSELPPELQGLSQDSTKRTTRGRSKTGGFSRHRMRDRDESVIQQLTDGRQDDKGSMSPPSRDHSLSPEPQHDFRHVPIGGPFAPPVMGRGYRPYFRRDVPPFPHRPNEFEEKEPRERERERHEDRERESSSTERTSRRSRDHREKEHSSSSRRYEKDRDEKRSSHRDRKDESSRSDRSRSHRSHGSSRKRSRSKETDSDERSKHKKT